MNGTKQTLGQAVAVAMVAAALLLGGVLSQGADARSLSGCEKGSDKPEDCHVNTVYLAVEELADTPWSPSVVPNSGM